MESRRRKEKNRFMQFPFVQILGIPGNHPCKSITRKKKVANEKGKR
jgi:hypothetical protein